MQDENTIREVIHDLSNMTGKEVSKENIKWLTKESKPKWISEMSMDEISNML